jgi:3-dehydroquinate synthase
VELSFLKNILKKEDYNKIQNYLYKLNVSYNYKLYIDDLKTIYFDKKALNNKLKFILLKGIGQPVICDNISKTDLLKII